MSSSIQPIPLPVLPPATPALSEEERRRIGEELRNLNVGQVRFDEHNRQLYSTDASLYQVTPIGVVIPCDTDAVARIMAYCAARGVAVLPRGGGTSLAGQCTNCAVVVDLTPHCRKVLEVDAVGATCRVEPGISIDELNRQLAARGTGLFFAADPATVAQAAIGGCIGNNAAGARSIRYGRTSENLAGVEIVLSTAERVWLEPGAGRRSPTARRLAEQVSAVVAANADEIRRHFPKLTRRNAGYGLDLVLQQLDRGVVPEDLDLSGLICGSEGTLGITVAARLKLHPIPRERGLALVSFGSLDAAMEALLRILPTRPSAVELLDDVVIHSAEENPECRQYVEMFPQIAGKTPPAVLYVEYQVEDESQQLDAFFAALREVLPDAPSVELRDAASMGRAWTLRKSSEALLHGIPGRAKPVTFVEDNSVPVENLRRFIAEFRQIVERHGAEAAYYAHASVGVLHVRPILDLHDPQGRRDMQEIAVEVADLARRSGGVMSGEHGDGRVRGPLLENFYGRQIMQAFKQIKTLFDPAGILNPGNIVDPGPIQSITQNLRVDANNPNIDLASIDTYFRYDGDDGFAGAVELCNGAGFCRKTAGGAMCPSYRATLDERHSTRGRANAIRLAVTGQTHDAPAPPVPRWDDLAVNETLDLCLSCKACKTECPSNVDLAQLKSEYLAQQYRSTGRTPLAARIFGNVRTLNRLGSLAPALANWLSQLPPVRAMMNRLLGLAPGRSIPPFARSLHRWFDRRKTRVPPGRPRVVLWPDCFVTYSEPRIGKAATAVLEALGYCVEFPSGGCCARPMISTGLLEQARNAADRTLAAVRSLIDDPAVVAVVVLEPSCLSAIQDDWLKLRMKTDLPTRRRLAGKAMLLEQFVEQAWERHPNKPELAPSPPGREVILHGHCHQKALWGSESSAAVLRRVCNGKVDVLPSGCCGMAGSFGYAERHYDVSTKIGELSVFPPIRAAHQDAVIVAPGTSCRHQIKDGAGRCALHPAELLADVLAPAWRSRKP